VLKMGGKGHLVAFLMEGKEAARRGGKTITDATWILRRKNEGEIAPGKTALQGGERFFMKKIEKNGTRGESRNLIRWGGKKKKKKKKKAFTINDLKKGV